ncbi:MAG: hypothetical protein O3B86_17770, partial [Planctomycetota bacterium]|nr:hypothetical protein [Planctomycetota bacterium]
WNFVAAGIAVRATHCFTPEFSGPMSARRQEIPCKLLVVRNSVEQFECVEGGDVPPISGIHRKQTRSG